jgi:hypothetical protein
MAPKEFEKACRSDSLAPKTHAHKSSFHDEDSTRSARASERGRAMSGGGNVALVALASALAGAKLQDIVKALLADRRSRKSSGGGGGRGGGGGGGGEERGALNASDNSPVATSTAADDDASCVSAATPLDTAITTAQQQQQQQQQQQHALSPSPSRPPMKTITRKTLGSPTTPTRSNSHGAGSSGGAVAQLCSACGENAVPPVTVGGGGGCG